MSNPSHSARKKLVLELIEDVLHRYAKEEGIPPEQFKQTCRKR